MVVRELWYVLFLGFFMTGCALAPGMQTLGLQRADSGAALEGEGLPSAIQTINAKLILELRETQQSTLSTMSTSQLEAGSSEIKPKQSQFFDSEVDRARSQGSSIADDYVYRVGPADILTIIVWEHPELTIPAGAERSAEQAGVVVGNNGTIYFPYAGIVQVAGKTLPEIRKLLTQRLSTYIEDVKLDVRMAQYNYKRIYMVGEVKQPSVQVINNIRPTLIEMISAAGGFTDNADTQTLTLTRDGSTYRVDLLAFYERGDATQNVLLQSGDVVNVWDRSGTKMFVLGEVNSPGSYYVNKGRKSLAEALSDAGGVNPNTSNPGQVFVFRQGEAGSSDIFHLNASSPDALLLADQFPLKPRDVVYVDAADVVRWSRVVQNISGTTSVLNQASQTSFPLFKGGQ